MQRKTEAAVNYLLRLRETMERIPKNNKTIDQLSIVNDLIKQYEETQNPEIQKKLINLGRIAGKEYQLALFDLMLGSFRGMIETEEVRLSSQSESMENTSGAKLFFGKLLSGIEDTIFSLAKITDYFSSETSFKEDAVVFIANIEQAKAKLLKSKPNRAHKLDDVNKIIDIYTRIHEKKYNPSHQATEPAPEIIDIKPKATTKRKKAKTASPEIPIANNLDIQAKLKSHAHQLAEVISTHHKIIREAMDQHDRNIPHLTPQLKKDPLINEQLELLKHIADSDLPRLIQLKEQTIEETWFLINASPTSMSKEQEERRLELRRKYSGRTLEELYEILIKQREEYIGQITSLAGKIDGATNLISARIEEIDALSKPVISNAGSSHSKSIGASNSGIEQTEPKETLSSSPSISELRAQLNSSSEFYDLTVAALQGVIEVFETNKKSKPYVEHEPLVQELLKEYNRLLLIKDEAIRKREQIVGECTDKKAHLLPGLALEKDRIQKQIDCTQEAFESLREVSIELAGLIADKLNPTLKTAEEERLREASLAHSHIKLSIKNLEDQVENAKKPELQKRVDVADKSELQVYVQLNKDEIDTAIEVARGKIKSLEALTTVEINSISLATQKNLDELASSLSQKITNAQAFLTRKDSLIKRLEQLAAKRNVEPLSMICGNDISDLQQICNTLPYLAKDYHSKSKRVLDGILDDADSAIKVIEERHKSLNDTYIQRSNSAAVGLIDRLTQATRLIQNTPWAATLLRDLNNIKSDYLALNIEPRELVTRVTGSLEQHVTADNLAQLTNNAQDASAAGNFLRALVEGLHAIWNFITQQEKPRYSPQLFASSVEEDYAAAIRQATTSLSAVQTVVQNAVQTVVPAPQEIQVF